MVKKNTFSRKYKEKCLSHTQLDKNMKKDIACVFALSQILVWENVVLCF